MTKLNPGPGAYNPTFLKTGQWVSLHIKTKTNHQYVNSLGPGQYNSYNTIQPSKGLFLSKYKSTKNTKFNPITVVDKQFIEKTKSKDANGRSKQENPESFLSRDKAY